MALTIAHRGASGYRPEHTLAAYELAIRMGAHYIEPDLVSTKDGVLVARHENEISATTDVAKRPEFSRRETSTTVDGIIRIGWFTEDFTLAELKTMRAVERLPRIRPNNTLYDGDFEVPTLDEVIALARRYDVGIYPETKHPSYFASLGLALEQPLVRALRRHGLTGPTAKVFVQSFESANLHQMGTMVDVPLVQLIAGTGTGYDAMVTPGGLAEIATYAAAIGPDKTRIVPRDPAGYRMEPTSLVEDAHAQGLLVHPYTFRAENVYLPEELRSGADPHTFGDIFAEYELFFALGVDGVFADHPDTAVHASALSPAA
ncbi:glycerophosphodiester phosphodiesterase [soil metagenome]